MHCISVLWWSVKGKFYVLNWDREENWPTELTSLVSNTSEKTCFWSNTFIICVLLNRYETLPKSNILGISFLCFVFFLLLLFNSPSRKSFWVRWVVLTCSKLVKLRYCFIYLCLFFFLHSFSYRGYISFVRILLCLLLVRLFARTKFLFVCFFE